jgi:hypothetical protein
VKTCTKCGIGKPLELFHKIPKSRDGRASQCKVCAHIQLKAARQSVEAKARFKVYARRAALRSRYGIDDRQYETMFMGQQGCCLICERPEQGEPLSRRLAVDHCAETKIVRALLCHKCNRGLGLFLHDPVLLKKAAAYLEDYYAQRQRTGNGQRRDAPLQA